MFGRSMLPVPLFATLVVGACSDLATAPGGTDAEVSARAARSTIAVVEGAALSDSSLSVGDTAVVTFNGVPLSKLRAERRFRLAQVRVRLADTGVVRLARGGNAIVARRDGRTSVLVMVNRNVDTVPVVVGLPNATLAPDAKNLPAPFAPEPVPVGALPAGVVRPEAPRATVNTTAPAVTGRRISVATANEFSSALAAVRGGDEIVIADRAVLVGNFVLPARGDGGIVTVRSATTTPAGVRVTPSAASSFARLLSPNTLPAISAASGTRGWHLQNIEVSVTSAVTLNYNIVALGFEDRTVESQPAQIVLDRVYVHSTPDAMVQRCIGLQGRAMAVVHSWISDCHARGFDSQAIAGWAGAGPFLIENNHLEGAAQNVLFGGNDPWIPGIVPSDITIRRNHLFKPLSWRGRWQVKNLFQLKSGRRVLFEENYLENCWQDAQTGWAIIMYSVNQGGTSPRSSVQDITLRSNVIRNATSGINVIANGGNVDPSAWTARVLVENNQFVGVGIDPFNGSSNRFVQILDAVQDVTLVGNTFTAPGRVGFAVMFADKATVRTHIMNNLFGESDYGIFGAGMGEGNGALRTFAPDSRVVGNALVGRDPGFYPIGNYFPSNIGGMETMSFATASSVAGVDSRRLAPALAARSRR